MNASLLLPMFAEIPIPRDLPLPLPLPEIALEVVLVVTFLVHILFVNLMVGGSFMVFALELLGMKHARYDKLAHTIAATVTVNKSMAVVMGIGPLLCINLLYTVQWYSANALTGHAWLLIIPSIIVAFLLTYLHKYTWERWAHGLSKQWHLALGGVAALFFMFIPLIFLSNINLMLFPNEWEKVRGFLSSLQIGNVFPRHGHFTLASIAVTGLFLVGWLGRKGATMDDTPSFTKPELRRLFYKAAFLATLGQFAVGPVVLLTLPSVGLSTQLYAVILGGVAIGLLVLGLLRKEMNRSDAKIGGLYAPICILFSALVLSMGSGRHIYREAALADHKASIQERTASYRKALSDFNSDLAAKGGGDETGESLFANCAACHAKDRVLVGPPLTEIAQIYKDNPDGIVTWARGPGKKRPAMPPMPAMGHLGEGNLRKIAEYMISTGSGVAR